MEKEQDRVWTFYIGSKDADRNVVIPCPDLPVPDFIKWAKNMGMGCVDEGSLNFIAVFLIQQFRIGKSF